MEISWNFVSLKKWEPWLWFSTCTEIFNTLFQHVFNSFQHALQFSTYAEIFNTLFQHVFNTFQT